MIRHTPRSAATLTLAALFCLTAGMPAAVAELDKHGTLWGPFLEWSLENPAHEGNPFDVEAYAVFEHPATGATHRTGLFFAGGDTWRFRFTGTRTGEWQFRTESPVAKLDGHRGVVRIEANPDPDARGYLVSRGHHWAWQTGEAGETRVFTPQLVMYRSPQEFHANPEQIEADIEEFIAGHGFTGFHTAVLCRWFDIEKERSDEIGGADPNPDFRTFDALELLITKVHAAGGFVHIWKWGDEDRRMTPIRWAPDGPQEQQLNRRGLRSSEAALPHGINGPTDRRLQRYIAARLGPIPGWTLGYGFDLGEWVRPEELQDWHNFMKGELGWPRIIGGRAHGHGQPLEKAFATDLDYLGYETHRPTYETYVEALALHPDRPAFMEDRFRVRDHPLWYAKDYSLDDVRRGLWHSTMAGGVANIWGYLLPERDGWASHPFPNRDQITTYARFFAHRFSAGLEGAIELATGMVLFDPAKERMIVYAEDQREFQIDMTAFAAPQPVIAIDTKTPYFEFQLGEFAPEAHHWRAPYVSDWALAIGRF